MGLILIRHPVTVCAPNVCYGRLDLDCDAAGLDRCTLKAAALARRADRVISSPAKRAQRLARRLSLDVETDPRLQELDFGAWEGQSWDRIGVMQIDAWREAMPHSAPPGGESLASLRDRCRDWLEEQVPRPGLTIAVSHAGPIRVIRALCAGLPLLDAFNTPLTYGGMTYISKMAVCNLLAGAHAAKHFYCTNAEAVTHFLPRRS